MRVMVADDAVLFREGLARVLGDAGFEVVAQVGDAQELLRRVREDPPDVAVVDIRMPPTHTTEGLDAARVLQESHPGVGVLVLSAHVEPHYALQLIEDGAEGAGYLLKERVSDLDELVSAVSTVASGGSVVDPQVIEHLVKAGMSRGDRNVSRLSARELEVLAEMARGHSNATIASTLFITQRAVEKHINSIFSKLGLAGSDGAHPRVRAVLLYLSGSVS
jgi:DNA-binding NarL/FixJ family response regulator